MNVLRTASRLALRRGLAGGSGDWLTVGALLALVSWMRRRADAPPPVLHHEVLEPGESIQISVFEPPRR